MNIYIPIEVKVRDLEGRSLLAMAAAERGHTVILGEKKDTISLAKSGKLPSGIIHMKSITPHESMLETLSEFRGYGHKVTVQDEENGITDHAFETFGRLRFSEESLVYMDRVFAWGEHDGSGLRGLFPEASEKIAITGSPRVDFWRKDFENYFRIARGSDDPAIYSKPYILIASNFGSFLNENRFWNILARLRSAGYFERDENRELHEYENAAYQTRLIGKFVEVVRELSQLYTDYNIIVRPHPVESIEGWERIIGDFPNVIVKRTGSISKWIRHSRLMIHNGCSSAIEAAMSGANRIAYRPLPNDIERAIPNLISINVFSVDDLKNVVSKLLGGFEVNNMAEVKKTTERYIQHRIKNWEGRLAADRIVDEWEAIALAHSLPHTDWPELLKINKSEKPSFVRKMKRRAVLMRDLLSGKRIERNDSKKLLKSDHKFPDFKEEEIDFLLERLQSLLGRFENVSYKRFGEKSFIVTRVK